MRQIKQTSTLIFAHLLLIAGTGNSQNVGIGTTTPVQKLDIRDGAGGYFRFWGNTIGDFFAEEMRPHINTGPFTIYSGTPGTGIPRFIVTNEGTVGIGTTTPNPVFKLETRGGGVGAFSNADNSPTGLVIGRTAPEATFGIAGIGGNYSTDAAPGDAVLRNNSSSNKLILQTGIVNATMTLFNNSVGIGTPSPAASAILDINSNTQGLLPPRMTTAERNAIASPATGLVLFNTTTNSLEIRNSSGWVSLAAAADALPTIQIGTQKWMSKNLDVAFYRNGDPIPQVTDQAQWATLTTGAWCYYNNDSTLGNKYGKLYNWYALNDPRGLAPQGWHIPSDAEWAALESTLGGTSVTGGKLKEAGTSSWTGPNTAANNLSAFAALPGGSRMSNGFFCACLGEFGHLWSATENNATFAWLRRLSNLNGTAERIAYIKTEGLSVRCVRD